MTSASRAGSRRSEVSRARISSCHSRMVDAGQQCHRLDERPPRIALSRQHPTAICGQRIKPPAALARLLYPLAVEPAAFFKSIQQWIERRDMELELPIGALFDQL